MGKTMIPGDRGWELITPGHERVEPLPIFNESRVVRGRPSGR